MVVNQYLLDTCILLEYLLDQVKADEVEKLLTSMPPDALSITEFSLYSIGINMLRRGLSDRFLEFVDDLLVVGRVRLLRLRPDDMSLIAATAQRYKLDFDDAYQYVAAEKHDLTLLSFDADFERTERGRRTPAQILEEVRHVQ